MCGITAQLSRHHDVRSNLLYGITQLLNRGYDSAGACLATPKGIVTLKFASSDAETSDCIERLNENVELLDTEKILQGMMHTRWSTHGPKTQINAHPHSSNNGRFFVVHNGIITNYKKLKSSLQNQGFHFQSQTDTEVIPVLMESTLQQAPDLSILDAWHRVVQQLEGTWALVMMDALDRNSFFVAKNGSPLLVAFNENGDECGVSSEASGFSPTLQSFLELEENSCNQISWSQSQAKFIFCDSEMSLRPQRKIETQDSIMTFEPFRNWTECEIFQQPQTLWDSLNHGGRLYSTTFCGWVAKLGGLDDHRYLFENAQHLRLIACGSSLHAAHFTSHYFKHTRIWQTVQAIDASEFSTLDIVENEEKERGHTVCILISQSGETFDCIRALQIISQTSATTLGVVNVPGSTLSRKTDAGVYINAGKERAVGATKSFTAQCSCLTLIALWFFKLHCPRPQYHLVESLAKTLFELSPAIGQILPDLAKQAQIVAQLPDVLEAQHTFLLGKGPALAICQEGALKLKELAYLHAEAFNASSLKHGPFALINNPATLLFLCLFDGEHTPFLKSTLEQIKARNALVVIITNLRELSEEHALVVRIPLENEMSISYATLIFFQLLAVELAISRGHNPDFPKNLAKTVTTD